MIYYACLSCNQTEQVSEYVPELLHRHGSDLFRLIACRDPQEAQRYARWQPAQDGLARFITADGGTQTRVIRLPPPPYMDFAMMPSLRASLELEGTAPLDTVQVKRRRFEYHGRDDDGTILFREQL